MLFRSTKQQSSTAMDVSSEVQEVIESLEADDENLNIRIVRDSADSILSSLKDVALTLVLAAVISMIIIFIFFGDYKASLIVGSSIPTSILVSLILMTSAGFSLNIITMSGLVLGVGMMVDNSIVVLESCFRAIETEEDKGLLGYAKASPVRNQHCAPVHSGIHCDHLCGFPAAGISAGHVGTDVRLHGIRYRILYVRLLPVSHYHCSPYLYGL